MVDIHSVNSEPESLRLAVSPAEAVRITSVGRKKLYQAIGSGTLRSLKIGRRRLITIEALKEWLTTAERANQEAGDAR